ncbi:MAG: DNA repair protein RecN [Bacteroidales bacterium]
MLKSLFIRNYVLIDHLDIRFDESFTVMTGETGAGKSIILGALSLALGQRADTKSIKSGADKCVIEAVFDISAYRLEHFFAENALEYDAETCILRRELFASGKTRAFINDSPAPLNVVKELGNRLIDIHSQHQNLLVADNKFQLRVVDVMAGNEPLLRQYREAYARYLSLKKELKELEEKARQSKQDEDYIRFQLQQLDEVKPVAGEQEQWEAEQKLLTHAEDIKGSLFRIAERLNGEGQGGIQSIKEALSIAQTLERFYPSIKEAIGRLRTACIDLTDLAAEINATKEDIEYNPERLQWVNGRLNTLYSLLQKHRLSSIDELLALQETYRRQLNEMDFFGEQIAHLTQQTAAAHQRLSECAVQLSGQRKAAAESISAQLTGSLSQLGMQYARFRIDFTLKNEPESDGIDDVCFLFSANRNGALERVAQAASGGEISRLMLCVKAMIAGYTALPAIIFDEVDMGVSGDTADKMGNIMRELSAKMQVIAITHLPQIASKGQGHYLVYKEDLPEHTVTQIRKLGADERINEVARLLSGASLTEAAIANARDLLQL